MAFITLREAWENDIGAGYALVRKMRGISSVESGTSRMTSDYCFMLFRGRSYECRVAFPPKIASERPHRNCTGVTSR